MVCTLKSVLELLCHVNQVIRAEGMPNRPEWSGLRLLDGDGSSAIIRHSAVCLSFAES